MRQSSQMEVINLQSIELSQCFVHQLRQEHIRQENGTKNNKTLKQWNNEKTNTETVPQWKSKMTKERNNET